MKRLLRSAFNFSAAVSALLLAGVCVLWVRSAWYADRAVWEAEHPKFTFARLSFTSEAGRIVLLRQCSQSDVPEPRVWKLERAVPPGGDPSMLQRDLDGSNGPRLWTVADGIRERGVALPDWMLALPLAAAPAAWAAGALRRWRARRRRLAGRCEACGYELRASPDRCPECGRPKGRADLPHAGRGPRLAAAAVLALSAAAAGALAWWSDPARGAPPDTGYPWEAARGEAADRMVRRDPFWGRAWHQTVWHRSDDEGGDLLVVLMLRNHMALWGRDWNVSVFDRSMNVVRSGKVYLQADCEPYRLLEVRSDDPAVPAEYRGRWWLGVESRPPGGGPLDKPPEEQSLDHLVEWDDRQKTEDEWRFTTGVTVRVRSAEP